MNTLINNELIFANGVRFSEDMIIVSLADGREVSVPLAWFPRLHKANQKQLSNWRFIGKGQGIHWEELDEDISVETLLR